jgi:hypothetical protein
MPVPDFSPGEVLTAAAMDSIGLWKIAETSFNGVVNPFINGCFTSDYENYLVKIHTTSNVLSNNLYFRMRTGSTPETGAVYDRFGFLWTTSAVNLVAANQVDAYLGGITNSANSYFSSDIEIFAPNKARHTIANCDSWASSDGARSLPSYRIETTTAYTGIELLGISGTLTGTMRVYGYRD